MPLIPPTPIVWPESLPKPTSGPIEFVDPRTIEGSPFEARTLTLDIAAVQDIQLGPLDAAQALTLRTLWKEDLDEGGNWLATTWPVPWRDAVSVRKFLGPLNWRVAPGGYWNVSGKTLVVRSREAPLRYISDCLARAMYIDDTMKTDPETFFLQQYRSGAPFPDPPVGMVTDAVAHAQLPGEVYGGTPGYFPGFYTLDWATLALGLNVANIFSITRIGVAPQPPLYTGGSITSFALTVQNVPTNETDCRVLVFLAAGSWESLPVFINSNTVSDPDYGGQPVPISNDLSGTGTRVQSTVPTYEIDEMIAICILKNTKGSLSATWVEPDPGFTNA